LVPAHPHVAANEFIAARLADVLGLPMLDVRVVDMAGELLFASGWMQHGTFYPSIDEQRFRACENRDRVYDLVVLDSWIANVDRHAGNLVVRQIRSRGEPNPRHLMLCNDHSHCLVLPGQNVADLAVHLDAPPGPYIRLGFIREAIVESHCLAGALGRLSALTDDVVHATFNDLPARFLPSGQDGDAMRDYLLERRRRLPDIFRAHRGTFPHLDGGPL
jgi:hypothetical protein